MYEFTVSEARTAIACPRIFYFDEQRFRRTLSKTRRVTRIWTGAATAVTGCSTLFHATVERFQSLAARAPEVRQALEQARATVDPEVRTTRLVEELKRFLVARCLNRVALNSKAPPQQQAFVRAIDQYMGELADALGYAVTHGRSPEELVQEFFGDTRKRVDVTFHVGPQAEPVRVRGVVDLIYFDYRTSSHRIVDFKLLPAESIAKDLLQTTLYSLMHDQQHHTAPAVAVLYLHPQRSMVENSWDDVLANRHKVFDLLASMAQWSDYDEARQEGLKPPGSPVLCAVCPWSRGNECQRRLGPVATGDRVRRWSDTAAPAPEPLLAAHVPPDPAPAEEYDDVDEEGSVVLAASDPGDAAGHDASRDEDAGFPPNGLLLGTTVATHQPVILPLAALATHVSVVGAAGSGKSWLAKVIVEEALRQGVPVLAIDPQGDLVQFLHPSPLSPEASASDVAAQTAFRDRVDVRIWTPGTSHGQRLSLSPLRLARPEELASFDSPQRREEEWDAMLGVVAGNLVRLAKAGGDAEVQHTVLLHILRKLAGETTRQATDVTFDDILQSLDAPDAPGLDAVEPMISKREREKLRQRLYARLHGPMAHLFTGGTPIDLEHMTRPERTGTTPLNVMYLNALPDDSQKQYFVAALAAEVYRWMITSASTGRLRLLVFLDEARDFLPAGTSKPPAKEPLLRLFAQGRKFGVGCLVCTQSPRSVDYQVFSNASTKLIGRLEAAQDIQRVAEWFSTSASGAPAWLAGRSGAAPGTLVGRWPEMSPEWEGAEFRSRRLYSLHEGAWSPDRVESAWHHRTIPSRDAPPGNAT